MLMVHFIGLAMGVGTGFAFLFLSRSAAGMAPEEARSFMLSASVLTRMGHLGLVLLLISGAWLIIPYWSSLPDSPYLIAKLVLFVVLGGLIGMISAAFRKARNGQPEYMLKARRFGPLALLTSIAIVVLAVLNFQ